MYLKVTSFFTGSEANRIYPGGIQLFLGKLDLRPPGIDQCSQNHRHPFRLQPIRTCRILDLSPV